MKEIKKKDLNIGLLNERSKKELIQIICDIGTIANDYTQTGPLMGDRVLSKLNLVHDEFHIRYK